ncbi:MAG TPA: ABC transporter permease [Vicinamibacterales bacterium]|nr:ABC transporter permease [Vicinamibacterales bacterium]
MPRLLSILHSIALFAYPRAFRGHFGAEIVEAFDRRVQDAAPRGRGRALGLGAWLIADAVASGFAERFSVLRRPKPQLVIHESLPIGRSQTMTWESLLADARLSMRRLLRAPLFAGITVLTLGLGIGASTAIFAVAHAVLFRPLPYSDPDRLVAIWSNNTHQHETKNPVSPANFQAFKKEAPSFAGVEAMYAFFTNSQLERDGSKDMMTVATVTPGMFDLIGRQMLRGRGLREGDDTGVVISHGSWIRLFGSDPEIVGKTVRVTGAPPFTVIGVAPEDFLFPYKAMLGPSGFTRASLPDAWVMLPMRSNRMVDAAGQPVRPVHFLAVIGRLKPSASLDNARAELDAIAARRATEFTDTNDGWQVTALPLHAQVTGQIRPVVLLLAGGVATLLLMMCLNIANVLLARASGAQRDIAVRSALGASFGRLVQLSLVESAMLGALGGAAGLIVVFVATPLIVALAPADLPRLSETRFDATVLGFGLTLSVVTGLLVGVIPALASTRLRKAGLADSHRTTASKSRQRTRASLVVAELALAVMLTAGAGLMLRSFLAVMNVDPGFNASNLLTFQQSVPQTAQQSPAANIAFLDQLLTRLQAAPGVQSVGGTTRIPLGSTQVTTMLAVDGRAVPDGKLPEVDMRRAVGDYFSAMGMPVVQGRVFTSEDRTAASGLAVVNAALAAKVFPGEAVVGRRVRMGPNPNAAWLTIIGIVGDIRHSSLEDAPRPEIYISYLQGPPTSPFMVVRASGDATAVAASVRNIVKELGADPPFNVSTMAQLRSESTALRRFTVLLAGIFGALALLLAAAGVYGVMALVVAERTDEVGVRVALGATPSRILSMMIGHAARLGVTGLAIGTALSLILAQAAKSLLFGIQPTDVVTFVGVPLGLLMVALAAALVPARRATKISPVQAIRS